MKTSLKILLTTVAFAFFFGQGYSQAASDNEQKANNPVATAQGKFVDSNGNGVCDNFEMRGGSGKGANFVDKDGDGVCDQRGVKAASGGNREFCGKGYQHRHGCGQGQGNCCGRGPCKGKPGQNPGGNNPGNTPASPDR